MGGFQSCGWFWIFSVSGGSLLKLSPWNDVADIFLLQDLENPFDSS